MGNYNPDAPFILGNEFAGIKDFDLEFSYNNNAAEYGVGFTLPGSTTITDARVYTHPLDTSANVLSPDNNGASPLLVNIYPAGKQYDSGPIRRVVIPAVGGQVTGFGTTSQAGSVVALGANVTVPGAPLPTNAQIGNAAFDIGTGFQILTPPTDSGAFGSYDLNLWFGTDQYSQLLQGKRILELNVLYYLNSATGVDAFSTQFFCNMVIGLIIGNGRGSGTSLNSALSTAAFLYGDNTTQLQRFKLGEATTLWLVGSATQLEALPWTPGLLQNFNLNATQNSRFGVRFYRQSGNAAGAFAANPNRSYFLSAVALEVIYCEEQRVAYGGRNIFTHWPYGSNVITMRTPGTFATGPTLPAGDYFATVNNPSYISFNTRSLANSYPPIQALQTYYDLASHRPIVINRPFPIINGVGQQFTAGDPPAVPQITLHDNTGAVIQASHVYGRRANVAVDTATSPNQIIETSNTVAGQRYDQIRFYARRWGTADQPLTVNVLGASASITPAELDALADIVDGYKEVTLPLSQSITVTGTGTDIQATWSCTNAVGRQWEILGVSAPALSGVFGNNPESYLYQLPAAAQLGVATYLQGTGSTDALSWQIVDTSGPPTSGTTLDASTDAVVMLAQSPIQVSGVALTQQSMAVITNASLPDITDTFSRSVASGLGSTDTGQAYTTSGGVAGDYNVVNGVATVSMSAVNSSRWATITAPYADVDLAVSMATSVFSTGGSHFYQIAARFVDTNNNYLCRLDFATDATLALTIRKRVGGVETQLAGGTIAGLIYDPGVMFRVRFQVIGSGSGAVARAKVWPDYAPEPAAWQIWTDNTFNPTTDGLTAAGSVGIRSILSSINSNTLPVIASYDNFTVTNPAPDQNCGVTPRYTPVSVTYNLLTWGSPGITGSGFSYYEIQRNDAFDPIWQTIAKLPTQTTTFFRDFEARIGVISSYRIRVVNVLGFVGTWSASVAGTIAAPGVTGADAASMASGVLVFSSNTAQAGTYTLAHIEGLGNTPTEAVTFPESGRLKLQWMYGRDDQVAFHPTERGGEQFTRALVVQQAAVTGPVVQRGFNSMRDLAWASLPYVCVRNEAGDRWYANVSVPSGSFSRNRTLQIVQIQVTEVSTTAYAVTGT